MSISTVGRHIIVTGTVMTEGPEGRKSWQSPSQPKIARHTDQRQGWIEA